MTEKHSKLKTIVLAFSALIVHSACLTAFSSIFDNYNHCRIAVFLVTGCLGLLYIKTVLKEPKTYEPPDKQFLIAAGVVLLVFVFASTFTANFIINVISSASESESAAVNSASEADAVVSVLISIFLAPFAEEVVFRGFMYKQLSRFGENKAIIISAIVFALFHGTAAHLYTAYFGGLILACIYCKTKKLRYSYIWHVLFNALTLAVNAIINTFVTLDMMVICVLIIISNVFLVIAILRLFQTRGTVPLQSNKPKTDKYNDAETKRIVAEVLNERKSRR